MTSHKLTVTICNHKGLHARAAARFVKTAERYDATVTVHRADEPKGTTVSGTSILGLMMLAAEKGTGLRLHATGLQAEEALQALKALVSGAFGEE